MPSIHATPTPFSRALRRWRTTRKLSQLALAARVKTPPRHVSFLETGRSRPSEEMVLRLASALDLPLPDRNALLMTAGFAPAFTERPLTDEALGPIRFVIDRLLTAHSPYPGVVLDRWYDIVDANPSGRALFAGGGALDPDDPPNLIELLLGPYRDRIVNWDEVVWDIVIRLRREVTVASDDERLAAMLERAEGIARALPGKLAVGPNPVLFTRVKMADRELATFSTLVHFGSSRDVTVDGLHLELIYPADAITERFLKNVAG